MSFHAMQNKHTFTSNKPISIADFQWSLSLSIRMPAALADRDPFRR